MPQLSRLPGADNGSYGRRDARDSSLNFATKLSIKIDLRSNFFVLVFVFCHWTLGEKNIFIQRVKPNRYYLSR